MVLVSSRLQIYLSTSWAFEEIKKIIERAPRVVTDRIRTASHRENSIWCFQVFSHNNHCQCSKTVELPDSLSQSLAAWEFQSQSPWCCEDDWAPDKTMKTLIRTSIGWPSSILDSHDQVGGCETQSSLAGSRCETDAVFRFQYPVKIVTLITFHWVARQWHSAAFIEDLLISRTPWSKISRSMLCREQKCWSMA